MLYVSCCQKYSNNQMDITEASTPCTNTSLTLCSSRGHPATSAVRVKLSNVPSENFVKENNVLRCFFLYVNLSAKVFFV